MISAGGFSLLTWGLINAERTWTAPTTWGLLVAGGVLLAVFVLVENRAKGKLTDLGLLARRGFRLPVLVLMLISCVLYGVLFAAPSYLQTVLGNDATTGGMMLMPVALTSLPAGCRGSDLSVSSSCRGRWCWWRQVCGCAR